MRRASPPRYMRSNIENAIMRFESQDLTSIVELKMMLENARLTHELLSASLPLDPWESMFREINNCTTVKLVKLSREN